MTQPYAGVNDPRLNDIAEDLRDSTHAERELAYEQYGSQDIQIDEDAKVAEVDDCACIWVQAWVYVRKES